MLNSHSCYRDAIERARAVCKVYPLLPKRKKPTLEPVAAGKPFPRGGAFFRGAVYKREGAVFLRFDSDVDEWVSCNLGEIDKKKLAELIDNQKNLVAAKLRAKARRKSEHEARRAKRVLIKRIADKTGLTEQSAGKRYRHFLAGRISKAALYAPKRKMVRRVCV